MSDFIIEENKYNILTWKCDNILTKYEGNDEVVYVPFTDAIRSDKAINKSLIKVLDELSI
jgi:hypothetical protein